MSVRLDDEDLAAAVRGITVTDPHPGTDLAALTARGRRGLRRRRILSGAGLAAVVGAVAAASTVVPGLLSDDTREPIHPVGSPSATTAAPAPVSGDAVLLRRCGAAVGKDLSGWRIAVKAEEKNYITSMIALDPTGQQMATCYLAGKNLPWEVPGSWNSVHPTTPPQKSVAKISYQEVGAGIRSGPRHMFEAGSVTCGQPDSHGCVGFLFYEVGRLPAAAARIHAVASNGRSIDVPVKDSWYAVAWGDGHKDGMHPVDWKVYDAKGRLLGSKP